MHVKTEWDGCIAKFKDSIKRLKTLARLTGGRIFPSHDPVFWARAIKAPDAYR